MQGHSFPLITTEKRLPFYLDSIGANLYQYHVKREQGYHTHQLIYATVGEGVLTYQNHDGTYTTQPIVPNTLFYLPPNIPHEYYTVGDHWNTHWFSFLGHAVESTLQALSITGPNTYPITNIEILEKHFKRLYNTSKNGRVMKGYELSSMLYELLIQLSYIVKSSEHITTSSSHIMDKMIEYIDKHYASTINLTTLCNLVNVSPQHLCRLFQKHLGMRPLEYLCRIRIQEAKAKLLYTDLPINHISSQVGFNSTNYFCQQFKRYELLTPLEYRNLR